MPLRITEGEWKHARMPVPRGTAEWRIIFNEEEEMVADLVYLEGDAILMAASKELLAALKFLVREARASGIIEQEPCMVQAINAIEKAETGL